MGYQALLFCPDEKTARTVTQVLSELDFTVIPCTEPFGAVKKLMGEHFDAVVVDCDNEQNATLLFKSARNTPNNQSSLAVAVVEGQAGVAKAFRIGANLVLTKPINVEQSKGTLRVARGLLRKNESAKPATPAASTAAKPAAAAPAPPKPAPQATSSKVGTARPAPTAPLVRTARAGIPTQKPVPQPSVVASLPREITEGDAEVFEVNEESAAPSIAEPETKIAASQLGIPSPTSSAGHSPSSAGFGMSAASAPAPAREPKPSIATEHNSSTSVSEPESLGEKGAASGSITPVEETSAPGSVSAPAPSFTFGGNVSSGAAESTGGRNKKMLLAVAAVVLVAAGGYAAWMQWVSSSGAATPFTHVAARPVTTPARPQVTPSAAPAATTSAPTSVTSSAASSVSSPTPDSAVAAQPNTTATTSSDARPDAGAENAPAHPSKVSVGADTGKPSASAPAASKVPATKAAEQPIVIKNNLSQPAAKPAPTPDAPAPSVTGIAAADNGGTLPNLVGGQSNAPTPVLQTLNVSQGVSQGLLVEKTQPTYPANALRMRIEGAVELSATISKTGDISAVKIISGDPTLANAAADAVKHWKYKPYLLNGEPVEIETQVTVNFKLPN
jgi:periplasmic protein TonB